MAIVLGMVLAGCATAYGELIPEEIAIVAAQGNRFSESLAKYYAEQRSIPMRNICYVPLPEGEVLPHEEWTGRVRPALQEWLQTNDPQQKLRCLVTVWGVPLKIAARAEPTEGMDRYARYLSSVRQGTIDRLDETLTLIDELAGGEGATEFPTRPAAAGKSELELRKSQVELALKKADSRIANRLSGEQQLRERQRLQQLAISLGGSNVLLQVLQRQLQDRPGDLDIQSRIDLIRGRGFSLSDVRRMMEITPPSIERDALSLATIERVDGLLAMLTWIDQQKERTAKNETGSSFDSELSLVMWPGEYTYLGWQPNYLRATYANSQLRHVYRTLMVARIDAPTIQLAKKLIDQTLVAEAAGLKGKGYFDARGLASLSNPTAAPGSFEELDLLLLGTAQGLEREFSLDVEVDATPQLFSAGSCPEAALYCGWYSPGKYVPAFAWQPGAVAWHLTGSEATTLHDPESQCWCKRLLEEGVCATIGAVDDPGLTAFPKPNEFFGLLMQGELPLVECYYQTLPHTSWMLTLIGDPLYKPYAKR